MLDMLLTADAARKHDHDNSPSTTPHDAPTFANHVAASMLVQMPLSIVGSFLRRQTPSPSPSTTVTSTTTTTQHVQQDPSSGSPDAATNAEQHAMTASTHQVSSQERTTRSRSHSPCSSTAANEKPKKRASRSKTSYICARPPRPVDPRSKHIRPKVLLQLHQVIPSQRPKPTYEVIPFSLHHHRSTRRLARTFNTTDRLGPNDLLIVKSEDYATKEDTKKSSDASWGSRDVIGVICPAKSEKETTEICMDDGLSRWEVTSMQNGGLEFNTVDGNGLSLKARWVPKPTHSRRVSGMSASSQASPTFPPGQDDKKYTFSTISPTSRRHPIIATMTQDRIDVMDSYTMPSATSPSTPGVSTPHSPSMTPADSDMFSFMDSVGDQLPIQTDDALRRFIVVSGVWLTQQGYYSTTNNSSPVIDLLSNARPCINRTMPTSNLDSPRSTSPASTLDGSRRSIPKMLRSSTEKLPRCFSFTEFHHATSSNQSPSVSPNVTTRSRRANSMGNANLHSMSGSMRKRYGLAFEGETLSETEEERQEKRSAELLRIKELALPSSLEKTSALPLPTATPLEPVISIPEPIVIPPSSDGPKSPVKVLDSPESPALSKTDRKRKAQSTYNPIVTTGMWDSGVSERPGLRSRPTSMSVINEKKRKQEKKRERSRNKDESDRGVPINKPDWRKLKSRIQNLFRKDIA